MVKSSLRVLPVTFGLAGSSGFAADSDLTVTLAKTPRHSPRNPKIELCKIKLAAFESADQSDMHKVMQAIFDGHNDLLLRLISKNDKQARGFFTHNHDGHIDLARARQGGLVGGFFAIFTTGHHDHEIIFHTADSSETSHQPPLAPIDEAVAVRNCSNMLGLLLGMCQRHPNDIALIKTKHDVHVVGQQKPEGNYPIKVLCHMEGAEGLGNQLQQLEHYYDMGLRSLGPVWSRPNAFGTGVPFHFPASPDIGSGLTEMGFELVKQCQKLGILIDLAHLNEAGFRDVARVTKQPLVSTHTAVHAICPSSRNLTDYQLDAIADTGGMVGLNFGVCFLREDGQRRHDIDLGLMTRHLDYLLERLGEHGVALGSDFDGTSIATRIGDVSGLQELVSAMRTSGYSADLISLICRDNWLNMLTRTLEPQSS